MNIDTREPAVAQSYPTFWNDDLPTATSTTPQPTEDAYAAFVSLCEDEFPEEATTATDDE